MRSSKQEVIKYLRQNGPTQTKELDGIKSKPARRYKGVEELRINPSRSSGSSVSSSGTPLIIVYLSDEHEPIEVLRVWKKYHQDMVDSIPADSIYRATPERFRDAMKEIVDVDGYYSGRGGDNSSSGDKCPICEEQYEGKLPTHLEKDCQG